MATATKRFHLRGAAQQVIKLKDDEVLIAGPAGTGKSYGALAKLHMMALANGKCPDPCPLVHDRLPEGYHWTQGARILMVRKTLVSLSATGVQTYKQDVAAEALAAGIVEFYGGSRDEPPQYRYSNGSKIMLAGMDNPTKVMSSQFDVVYVQEATELTPTDWEKCTTRLRNGRLSFQQIIADCNPEQPTHWLKLRCDEKKTVMLYGKHTDNPILFDVVDGEYVPTERGKAYLKKLNNLTGVRKLRLLGGVWAAAEGVIFEDFDPSLHISSRKRLPQEWARVWGIDFGYTNPFCWQQWARDPDGRLWLEHEIYRTKRTVREHCAQIMRVVTKQDGKTWKYPRPEYIVCDHDAEDRATFSKEMGMVTRAARKSVSPGIQAMQHRFKLAGDGMPRIFLLADSLVDRDEEVAEAGLPLGLIGELPGYIWKPGPDGKPIPDEPLKQDDHSCDTTRYVIAEEDLKAKVRVRHL
jgi:phage terminase large subunit